jgi:hypothetical protein
MLCVWRGSNCWLLCYGCVVYVACACRVLRVACCVLPVRVACCVLRAACCVLRVRVGSALVLLINNT